MNQFFLYRCLKIMNKKDLGAVRTLELEQARRNSWSIRLGYIIFKSSPVWLRYIFIQLYVIRVAMIKGIDSSNENLAVWSYSNEKKEFQKLKLSGMKFSEWMYGHFSIRHFLKNIYFVLRILSIPRIRRILKLCSKKSYFVVSLRSAELIVCYALFHSILNKKCQFKKIYLSSESNPYALAAKCLAYNLGRQVWFVSHGMVPNEKVVCHFHGLLLDNELLIARYQNWNQHKGATYLLKRPSSNVLIKSITTLQRVLILSSFAMDWASSMEYLLKLCSKGLKVAFRPHPNPVFVDKKSLNKIQSLGIEVLNTHETIDQNILCFKPDLVIAGNTSGHLEALNSMIPSVYYHKLDLIEDDLYGLVQAKKIYKLVSDEIEKDAINDFYLSNSF